VDSYFLVIQCTKLSYNYNCTRLWLFGGVGVNKLILSTQKTWS